MHPHLRRAAAILLPAAVLLTIACGLAYVEVQQVLRSGANDPQVQLAEDTAVRLDAGGTAASLVPAGSVDLATSLAPFLAIDDAAGQVLATDGTFHGLPPAPPRGVLDAAAAQGRDIVTWQPAPGVRIALVAVRWSGGTVLAGRSLRLVEERAAQAGAIAFGAWLGGMVLLAAAVALAAWLWPKAPSEHGGPPRRTDPGSPSGG